MTDEALDKVAGGVQAGGILKGGEGDFSDYKPKKDEGKKKKRSYL